MIFTTKAEYGVRLLVDLGQADDGAPVALKAIAERENLPLAYLERIVALLRKADLVDSTRGARGGYRLARAPETIRMDEVVTALDGPIAPMSCLIDPDATDVSKVVCSHHFQEESEADSGPCGTKLLWTRVQGGVVRALQQTTLADLIAFERGGPAAITPRRQPTGDDLPVIA